VIVGDPGVSSALAGVISVADATSLAGLYAALRINVPMLLNAGGTFDRIRAAVGALGTLPVQNESIKATYSISVAGFTPAATATDFAVLVGSATKTVRLSRIQISGIASAAATVEISLFKRTVADSGGTISATPTIGQHDSNDAAPTAVLNVYSANPTLGTSGGLIRCEKLNLGIVGAAGQIVWDFSTRNSKGIVLRGIAQNYALNWGGAAVPGGTSLAFDFEFTEE